MTTYSKPIRSQTRELFHYQCNHCDYTFHTFSRKVWAMKIKYHNEKTHGFEHYKVDIQRPQFQVAGTNIQGLHDTRTRRPIQTRQSELEAINA